MFHLNTNVLKMWKYVNTCYGIRYSNLHKNRLIILKVSFKCFCIKHISSIVIFSTKGLLLLSANWDKGLDIKDQISKILFLSF